MNWTDELADAIARRIWEVGREPNSEVIRIEFKGGSYPDNEIPMGGMCFESFRGAVGDAIRETAFEASAKK